MTINRIFGKTLCSSLERAVEHVEKHGLDIDLAKYLIIGEHVSKGMQGFHVGRFDNFCYAVVVRGNVGDYGVLRSIRRAGFEEAGRFCEPTCKEHGTFPYAHGICPICH